MSSRVDVAADGWDIRARWFGVVIYATQRRAALGALGRALVLLSVD